MRKIWIKKFANFEEAEKFDKEYYQKLGSRKRLETIQFLREINLKFKNESREGLRRVIRIIQ